MKSVVKTAEMLEQFNEQEDAQLVSASLAMNDGEETVVEAISTIARVLGAKPSWARYSMGRIIFVETLEQAGKSADAIKTKWSRVCKESAITIPVSDDPQAKKKAEQRAKVREVFEDKADEELQAEMAHLLAQPTLKRIDEAKKLGKELELRQKEAGNDIKEQLNAIRKEIRECLGKCEDFSLLTRIHQELLGM